MSSSTKTDNRKKGILILCEGPTQGLHTDCRKNGFKFCLSFYCNGANSYLFANGTEIIKFKVKDSEIVATSLSLVNTSKNFSIDNLKKSRIKWISLIMMLLQLMIY